MTTTPLQDAYDALRAHLHERVTSDTADELRSVLWLCAEAVERLGLSGMALRDLGDSLTGAAMSPALRRLLDRHQFDLDDDKEGAPDRDRH